MLRLASIIENITLKDDGFLSAEYRPAFRVLAQMAAERGRPRTCADGAPIVRNWPYGVARGIRTLDTQIHNLVL